MDDDSVSLADCVGVCVSDGVPEPDRLGTALGLGLPERELVALAVTDCVGDRLGELLGDRVCDSDWVADIDCVGDGAWLKVPDPVLDIVWLRVPVFDAV